MQCGGVTQGSTEQEPRLDRAEMELSDRAIEAREVARESRVDGVVVGLGRSIGHGLLDMLGRDHRAPVRVEQELGDLGAARQAVGTEQRDQQGSGLGSIVMPAAAASASTRRARSRSSSG